jgi:hypothetical protein
MVFWKVRNGGRPLTLHAPRHFVFCWYAALTARFPGFSLAKFSFAPPSYFASVGAWSTLCLFFFPQKLPEMSLWFKILSIVIHGITGTAIYVADIRTVFFRFTDAARPFPAEKGTFYAASSESSTEKKLCFPQVRLPKSSYFAWVIYFGFLIAFFWRH